jgi:hypothetical protein
VWAEAGARRGIGRPSRAPVTGRSDRYRPGSEVGRREVVGWGRGRGVVGGRCGEGCMGGEIGTVRPCSPEIIL